VGVGWGGVLAALVVALESAAGAGPLSLTAGTRSGHRDFLKPGVQGAAVNDGSAHPVLTSPPWQEPRTDVKGAESWIIKSKHYRFSKSVKLIESCFVTIISFVFLLKTTRFSTVLNADRAMLSASCFLLLS
jgi:hypothetical protein